MQRTIRYAVSLVAILAVITTTPCLAEDPKPSQSAEDLVRQFYARVLNQEPGPIDHLVSETLDVEAIRRGETSRRTIFPDLHHRVDTVLVHEDSVAVLTTLSGRQSVDTPYGPATGKQLDVRAVDLLTLRNGRVHAYRHVASDRLPVFQAVGFRLVAPDEADHTGSEDSADGADG